MVSTEEEEILGVLDLVGQEKADGLQGLLASVHVVTQEEVVCLWREQSVLEQPEEVCILAVDVACKWGGSSFSLLSLYLSLSLSPSLYLCLSLSPSLYLFLPLSPFILSLCLSLSLSFSLLYKVDN